MCIPHRKYHVKPYLSPWFSAACAAAIVHRNYFFCLYQREKSSDSKAKFRQASNCCKRVLEAAKLPCANKTKESITSQKLASRDSLIVFSMKVYMLYFLYSTVRRCCLLYLIEQKLFAEIFL